MVDDVERRCTVLIRTLSGRTLHSPWYLTCPCRPDWSSDPTPPDWTVCPSTWRRRRAPGGRLYRRRCGRTRGNMIASSPAYTVARPTDYISVAQTLDACLWQFAAVYGRPLWTYEAPTKNATRCTCAERQIKWLTSTTVRCGGLFTRRCRHRPTSEFLSSCAKPVWCDSYHRGLAALNPELPCAARTPPLLIYEAW